MKGRILTPLALLLVFTLLAPALDGLYYHQKLNTFIQHINKNLHHSQLVVSSYQPGWFNSRATIHVLSDKAITMEIKQHIKHGPVIYDSLHKNMRVALASTNNVFYMAKPIHQFLLKNPSDSLLSMTSIIYFNGAWLNRFKTSVLSIKIPNELRFQWNGIGGEIYLKFKNQQITEVNSTLEIGSIFIKSRWGSDSVVQLTSLPISLHQQAKRLGTEGPWTGMTAMSIPSVIIKNGSNLFLSLKNLKNIIQVDLDIYNLTHWYDKIDVEEINYPGFLIPIINNLNLVLTLKDINTKALSTYPDSMLETKNQFEKLLLKTLTTNSNLIAQGSLNTHFGGLIFSLKAAMTEKTNFPEHLLDLKSHSALQLNISSTKALGNIIFNNIFKDISSPIDQANQPISTENLILADLIKEGIILQDKDFYVINILLNQGQLQVNGKNPVLTTASNTKHLHAFA